MWNTPTPQRLAEIPKLYETEHIQIKDKLIYLHFVIGSCDWYVCEFDGEDIFWGFAILNGDFPNAGWGYFSFSELREIQIYGVIEVDCELQEYWEIRPSWQVNKILYSQGCR